VILEEIAASTRRQLRRRMERRPLADLKARARDLGPPRPWADALVPLSIIAEIKRATPRFPDLAPDLDPAAQAAAYAAGGAAALSVLTDEAYFKTSAADLVAARAAVSLPVLRKDFTLDAYQIWESRVEGADAILLIVRMLQDGQIRDYLGLAAELGLAALVEVHAEPELERALDRGARIVGVNNRNLDTFETDLKTSILLRPLVPAGVRTVSESGIGRREEMAMLAAAGFDAVLIGETLIRAPDPAAAIRRLLGRTVEET
jgi:indole-3-glycerol phosphate synthase